MSDIKSHKIKELYRDLPETAKKIIRREFVSKYGKEYKNPYRILDEVMNRNVVASDILVFFADIFTKLLIEKELPVKYVPENGESFTINFFLSEKYLAENAPNITDYGKKREEIKRG